MDSRLIGGSAMSLKMDEADWQIAFEVFRACLPARGAKAKDDRRFLEALLRVPADGGRRFQRNVGARSRRSWARIPDDAGHGFQLIVGARMMGALRPTV